MIVFPGKRFFISIFYSLDGKNTTTLGLDKLHEIVLDDEREPYHYTDDQNWSKNSIVM